MLNAALNLQLWSTLVPRIRTVANRETFHQTMQQAYVPITKQGNISSDNATSIHSDNKSEWSKPDAMPDHLLWSTPDPRGRPLTHRNYTPSLHGILRSYIHKKDMEEAHHD